MFFIYDGLQKNITETSEKHKMIVYPLTNFNARLQHQTLE